MPFSPPQSVASTSSLASPLTIKKLVLDGKSKSEGALFRMYMKVSVCIDNVQPGALFPLFPESNARIISAEVHPLDDRFSPYYFSPDEHPLIEKGTISLQLPSMISKSYGSLFHANEPDTSRRHRTIDPALCSAQVLVSAYTIMLALPKEFPPQHREITADSEGEQNLRHPRSARKQTSMFNKNHLNYIVGCEVSLPFFTMPPRGPFLISIPVPRCLDNQLRMRIAIPLDSITRRARHSGDSTSSGDDMAGWDFLTDPPVTRRVDRSVIRNGDEDQPSDHTSVTSGVEVIQGAFQSTDCLHIRWAPPLPRRSRPENGVWRVNMQTSTAIMKCQILARNELILNMGISYEVRCSELWHPGVATIVGLDVVLDAKRKTISWPEEEHLRGWLVTVKDEAFAGIHKDISHVVSRHSSLESAFSTFLPTLNQDSTVIPPRGSASLLHAPLPSNNPPDYSFENSSPNGSPRHHKTTPIIDTRMAKDSLRTSKDSPPNAPVTLKINMLKLLRSHKNEITFTIRGVISIKLDPETPEDYIPLPKFNVLGIHAQEVQTWVSMHMSANDEIYLDDEPPSEHGRRLLSTGKEVQCEEETILIVPQSRSLFAGTRDSRHSPNTLSTNDSSSPSRRVSRLSRISRHSSPLSARPLSPAVQSAEQTQEMPLVTFPSTNPLKTPVLTHVKVNVTPLSTSSKPDGWSHRVTVTLPTYSLDSNTIRFGLATAKIPSMVPVCPDVNLVYAICSGRQMSTSIHKVADNELELSASITTDISKSQIFGEMVYSISLDASGFELGASTVECVYLVGFPGAEVPRSGKTTAMNKRLLDVILPCFNIPVSMYEVWIDSITEDSYSLKSTTLWQEPSSKFSQYHVPAGFYPSLRISLSQNSSHKWWHSKTLGYILIFMFMISQIICFSHLSWVRKDLHGMRSSVNAILYGLMNGGDPHSFVGGYYPGNERYINRENANRDWKDTETPVVIVSTMTTTLTVTQTSYTSAPSVEGSEEDSPIRTIRLSEADTLISPPRPTPAGPQAPASPTPRESPSKEIKTLVQIHALSLPYFRFPFPDETKFVLKKFTKFVYFLRKIWNFPMDPD